MFSDADDYYGVNPVVFVIVMLALVVLLVICVTLLILQHLRFRFKQQRGQLYVKTYFLFKFKVNKFLVVIIGSVGLISCLLPVFH